jgi:hypothetical protein
MTTSLKLLSLFLLITYLSYVFRIIFPLIDYAINYDFIVHELCEQKDNPNNMCMGKCHLQKEISKSVNQSGQNNQLVISEFINIPHYINYFRILNFPKISKSFFLFESLNKIFTYLEPIIPPPKY